MFTIIQGGELYAPDYLGKQDILVANGKIAKIGQIDPAALKALGLECEVIEATHCIVMPGLIDPHEHLIGAGGEHGFGSRTPEIEVADIVQAGITTVVGCLGTDVITRNLTELLGKARQLEITANISTFIYTGGSQFPLHAITNSPREDLIIVDKVIGIGEVAVSDYRSTQPTADELARTTSDAVIGGLLGGKAGVTHFHLGSAEMKTKPVRDLLDTHPQIPVESIYTTHVNRTEDLLKEGIVLARRGVFVDMDTVDGDLGKWLIFYLEHGGPENQLTVSSDAHTEQGEPQKNFDNLVACVRDYKMPLEKVLPFFTVNTATVLKLDKRKGRLQEGLDGDIVLIERESFKLRHVLANGKHVVNFGKMVS